MNEPNATFARIYREHAALVARLVRHFGVAADQVDDVAQEVWITAHRRLGELDLSRPIRPWLARVTHNHVRHHRRSGARRDVKIRALESTGNRRELDDPFIARDSAWIVNELLGALSDHQREVLLLCEAEGFSASEAAQVLEVPVNTVSSRLRLARRHCQERAAASGILAWALLLRASVAPERPGVDALPSIQAAAGAGSSEATRVAGASAGTVKFALASAIVLVTAVAAAMIGVRVHAAAGAPIERVVAPPVPAVDDELRAPALAWMAPPPAIHRSAPPRPSARRVPKRVDVTAASPDAAPTPAATPERAAVKSVAGENRLLSAAKRAYDERRRSVALALLHEHRQDYPRGLGADTRDLLLIRIHCDNGDERLARAVARAHPADPQFPGAAAPCGVREAL